ncbi:hypothetical protein Tco_0758712 [Tanacetum coccineum]
MHLWGSLPGVAPLTCEVWGNPGWWRIWTGNKTRSIECQNSTNKMELLKDEQDHYIEAARKLFLADSTLPTTVLGRSTTVLVNAWQFDGKSDEGTSEEEPKRLLKLYKNDRLGSSPCRVNCYSSRCTTKYGFLYDDLTSENSKVNGNESGSTEIKEMKEEWLRPSDEEVYVSQPPEFVKDLDHPLGRFIRWSMLCMGYIKGTRGRDKKDIMLVQVYVDDIIFGSTNKSWCDEFEALMKSRFQMSSIVALTKDEEAVDVDVTPKTSHLNAVKRIFKYLKGKPHLGLCYPRESPFDLEVFSDNDYGGYNLDRKSTIGGCQFLGQRLISWQCKKQTIVATSTTEAEYVAAANCCGQVLWVQNQLLDYGFNFMNTKIHIDNESTICIVKNPVYHSKTKHIEIRHHFIRDCYEKKLISVEKIHTDLNVADLLTKPFDGPRFNYLVVSIGMINT